MGGIVTVTVGDSLYITDSVCEGLVSLCCRNEKLPDTEVHVGFANLAKI